MTKGEAVLKRLAAHLRGNAVAYIALMVSVIGGGGGYAIAATTHATKATKKKTKTALVACVSDRSGELFLHKGSGKCVKGRHEVKWNVKGKTGATGAAGTPAPSIFAAVDAESALNGLQPVAEKGMTVTRTAVGTYTVTITDPTCADSSDNVPTVTPSSAYAGGEAVPPQGATPVAYTDVNDGGGAQFTVYVGYVGGSGTFVPLDYSFDVQDTCLPPTSSAALATRK